MTFQKGHPPYPRRSRLEEVGVMERERQSLPIRRWTAESLDGWLLDRLNDRWPGFPEAVWRGKLAGFAASNDYLFIENDTGVLLTMAMRHAMTGKPVGLEVFAWSREAYIAKQGNANWIVRQDSDAHRDLIDLYRHAKEWMRSMGGVRIILGTCSDIAAGNIKDDVRAADYLVDVLL